MLGQIVEWFYGDLAGLAPDPAFPGFERVRIRPQPVPGITWAKAAHASPRGRVSVGVAAGERGRSISTSSCLPTPSAEVSLPAAGVGTVRESGAPVAQAQGVRFLRQEGDLVVLAIESGRYTLSSGR